MGDTSGIDEYTWGLLDTLERLKLYSYDVLSLDGIGKPQELYISPPPAKTPFAQMKSKLFETLSRLRLAPARAVNISVMDTGENLTICNNEHKNIQVDISEACGPIMMSYIIAPRQYYSIDMVTKNISVTARILW